MLDAVLAAAKHNPRSIQKALVIEAVRGQQAAHADLKRVLDEMSALAEAGALTRLGSARGRSVQIMPDAHYQLPEPLGPAFLRCLEVWFCCGWKGRKINFVGCFQTPFSVDSARTTRQ